MNSNMDRMFKLAVLCLIALFLAMMMTFALDWQDAFSQYGPTPTPAPTMVVTPEPYYPFYLPVVINITKCDRCGEEGLRCFLCEDN